MPLAYVFLSSLGTIGVVGFGIYYAVSLRYREARPAWLRAAANWDGEVHRTPVSLTMLALVDGRPLKVATVTKGRGRLARIYTVIGVAIRHPDDILEGRPAPEPSVNAWTDAWRHAEAAAVESTRRLPKDGTSSKVIEGVVADADVLVAAIEQHLATVRGREERVLAWRTAARELGLDSSAAYLVEGTWDARRVTITADLLAKSVTVRIDGEHRDDLDTAVIAKKCPDGYHYLDPIEDGLPDGLSLFGSDPTRGAMRARPAVDRLSEISPTSIVAGTDHTTLTMRDVTPSAARWRNALEIARALT